MNDVDWEGIFFGLGVLVLGTVILVVVLSQLGAFSRARIARREDRDLQDLLERYQTLAGDSARHQELAAAELVAVRERLDAIEQMMREVS